MIFKGGYIKNSDSVRIHKIKNIIIDYSDIYISVIVNIFITVNNNTIYTISLNDLLNDLSNDTSNNYQNKLLIETKVINNSQIGLFLNNKKIYTSQNLFEYELNINIDSDKDSNNKNIVTYSEEFIYDC